MDVRMAASLGAIPMPSGDVWHVTWGALFIGASAFCLLAELLRSPVANRSSIIEMLIGALTMIVCLILFLLVKGFATTEFFLIVLLMLFDFMANSTVMVFTSRRTVDIER